jgi:hypothetical protein
MGEEEGGGIGGGNWGRGERGKREREKSIIKRQLNDNQTTTTTPTTKTTIRTTKTTTWCYVRTIQSNPFWFFRELKEQV